MIEPLLIPTDVSRYLKLSKSNVYYLIQRRQIPHIKIGGNVRVKESALEKWLENQTVAARA